MGTGFPGRCPLEAAVIKILIVFKSASSMKLRNSMRVADTADEVLSMGAVAVTGVAGAFSTHVDRGATIFALLCFFLFPGPMTRMC
jgi:hypothetical protein